MGLVHKFTAPDGTTRTLPITTQGAESFVANLDGKGRARGGFAEATGTIGEAEYDAWTGWNQFGIVWRIFADGVAKPIFTGTLRDLVPAKGVVTLAADGVATKAEKTFDYWLWITRALERWMQMDAEPMDYFVDPEITAAVKGREIRFRVERGTPFVRRDGRDKLKQDADNGTNQVVLAHNDGGLNDGDTIWIAGDPYTVAGAYNPGDTTIPLTSNLTRDYGKDAPARWLVGAGTHVWRAGLVFPAPLVDLNSIAFRFVFPHGHDGDYTLELMRATFPSGNLVSVQSWTLNNNCPRKVAVAVSGNPDMLILRMKRTSQVRKAHPFALVLRDVRVGALTTLDDYKTHQVMTDIFNKIGVTPIVSASAQNAMPLEAVDGSAADVADEVALLDNWPWLIEDDSVVTDVQPVLVGRYRPWTGRTWKLLEPEFPFDPVPRPRFNRVRCPFRYGGGHKDYVTKTANPNPFPANQFSTLTIPLEDPLPSEVVAGVLSQNVANDLSQLRITGDVVFTEVEDAAVPGVKLPGHAVRAGDTAILTNYDDLTQKVAEVNFDDAKNRGSFPEQSPTLDVILRRRGRLLALGRSNAEATLGGLGIKQPAQVSLASTTPAARVKRKRGGRRDYDVVLPWNPVIEDVAGNATALKSYVVRWQYTDAAGVQIAEALAGKTRQVIVRDKEDGDVDGFPPTEVILKDVEHPGTWRIKYKVAAIDIIDRPGAFSAWSTPFLPQTTAPPMPTTATLRYTRQGFEALWDSARDPDDSTQPDPAIHHFHWRLKNPSAAVVREGDSRDFQKSIPLKKPAAGSWTLEVRSHDANGGFSAYRTASRTIRKPGRVRNRSMRKKGRTLEMKFEPPNAWDDGSTDDWDLSEVMDYRYDLRRAGAVVDTVYSKSTTLEYELTKAQAEQAGWYFQAFARGHDELDAGADAETGNITPNPLDISDRDVFDSGIGFNSLALTTLANQLDDPGFERDTTPVDSDGNAVPYESWWIDANLGQPGNDVVPTQDGTHSKFGVGYVRRTVGPSSSQLIRSRSFLPVQPGDWVYISGWAKRIGALQATQNLVFSASVWGGGPPISEQQVISLQPVLVANTHVFVEGLAQITDADARQVVFRALWDNQHATQNFDVAVDDVCLAIIPRWAVPDIVSDEIVTAEGLTNAAYADLATVGPTVTMNPPASGKVKVTWEGRIDNAAAAGAGSISVEVFNVTDSVTVQAASDNLRAFHAVDRQIFCSIARVFTGLNPQKSYRFRMKYRSAAGNAATFSNRYLIVEPV